MKKNVGKTDSIIRVVLALITAIIAYAFGQWWVYIISAILLITAMAEVCPIYLVFGLNTARSKSR